MGRAEGFTPQKLVVGVLFPDNDVLASVKGALEKRFGKIGWESSVLPFDYTDYYEPEMGAGLKRCFLAFKSLVDPGRLAEIKLATNALEDEFRRGEKRSVNLDPGLLALSRFVLATTKDNAHRIALRDGIYAELTLLYTKKDFQVLPWTYPDYAGREYRNILAEIREIYKSDLKQAGL